MLACKTGKQKPYALTPVRKQGRLALTGHDLMKMVWPARRLRGAGAA